MEIRNRLYDWKMFKIHRFPSTVISVGNLTVGGTGKTPMVIEIARGLRKRDPSLNIGVLSRGYRRPKRRGWLVSDGKHILLTAEESGDEPQVMALQLPGVKVFVGSDRVAIARRALARYSLDILILDDAYQHRRIHRDVDILLVDGKTGLEGGRVIPSGPLREFPWNLKRATCLVVNRYEGSLPHEIFRFCPPGIPIFKSRMRLTEIRDGKTGRPFPPSQMKNREVWAVCGIARPESFVDTLVELGVRIVGLTPFPDHHTYTREDLTPIAQQAAGRAIVTTWKDWVKWNGLSPFEHVYILTVEPEFLDGEKFYDFIGKFVYNKK